MTGRTGLWSMALAVLLTGASPAQPGNPAEAELLARTLRDILPTLLPDPLYQDTKHWGWQREVFAGIHWAGQGLRVRPEVRRAWKNDGRWWRARVVADPDRIAVDVYDLKRTGETIQVAALLSLETYIDYDRQTWLAGARLYSGSVRARARAVVRLRGEFAIRFEPPPGQLVPDVVIRYRLLEGAFGYDNVKVEHLFGLGGEAAELLGEALFEAVRVLKPGLEEKLLAKGRQALEKAAQVKEVRLKLSKWLGK